MWLSELCAIGDDPAPALSSRISCKSCVGHVSGWTSIMSAQAHGGDLNGRLRGARTRTRRLRRARRLLTDVCLSAWRGEKSRTSRDDIKKKKPLSLKKEEKNCLWPLSQLGAFHSVCLHKQGQESFIALLQSFLELFNGELTDPGAAVCFLPLQSILSRSDGSYVLYIQRLQLSSRSISFLPVSLW